MIQNQELRIRAETTREAAGKRSGRVTMGKTLLKTVFAVRFLKKHPLGPYMPVKDAIA